MEAMESLRLPEEEREKERESLTEMINEWKKGVEGKWTSVQEEWSVEKDRLRRARDEWESKTKAIEDGILARVEARLSLVQPRDSHPYINGSAKPNGQGLVTPPSPRSLSSDSMRPRSRRKRNGSSRGRTKSPSHIATPPANTDSDEDEEHVSASNNGSATSPGSRPRSPWTTDESSDSEVHPENTETSRVTLTSIKEKAGIQYPITPEASLVSTKEPPRLDSSVDGSDEFPNTVSRTLPHVHVQELNWFTVDGTVFNRSRSSFAERRSRGSHMASETGMNVGLLVVALVLAYGILSTIVSTDIHSFLSPFIVHMTLIFAFQLRIRIFKLMTSHEHALGSAQTCE